MFAIHGATYGRRYGVAFIVAFFVVVASSSLARRASSRTRRASRAGESMPTFDEARRVDHRARRDGRMDGRSDAECPNRVRIVWVNSETMVCT